MHYKYPLLNGFYKKQTDWAMLQAGDFAMKIVLRVDKSPIFEIDFQNITEGNIMPISISSIRQL